MSDYEVPFLKRRSVQLTALLLALIIFAVYSLRTENASERQLRVAALAFLEAADAGNFAVCRGQTKLEDDRFRFFIENRKALGKASERTLARQEPLRFNERTGYLYTFQTKFDDIPLRESVAVLAGPDGATDIFSARFHYPRLPRPLPHTHYNGPEREEIRAQTLAGVQAFDQGNWKYFQSIARHETGSARADNAAPLIRFKERFGNPVNRSPLQEIRHQDGLPGCSNLQIVCVVNRTSYKMKETILLSEEIVYLVRDAMMPHPTWEVYAFDPGKPRKITVPRPPAARPDRRKPAAPAPQP